MVDRPWWHEILLPPTDRDVAVQAVVLAILSCACIALAWRVRSARLVVIGAVLIVVGLVGLRAAH